MEHVRNVNSLKELHSIEDVMNENKLILSYSLLDTNLDVDSLESIAVASKIVLNKVLKNVTKRQTYYKIDFTMVIDDNISYNFTDWFIYDKKQDIFNYEEIYESL